MTGNQLAREASGGLKKAIGRAFAPFGVFFRGFLDEPRMVGSVIPSSSVTIDAMLRQIDWKRCKLFVEYGPGVGTFCPHILDRLPPGGNLLVIDTNPRFIEFLDKTIDDTRFHAVLGSAVDVEAHVRNLGYSHADYVLSGLPISTLPDGVAEQIVEATYRAIGEGGAFMTYQFRPAARELTEAIFDRITKGFVLRNIPPCLLTWGWKDSSS